MDREKTFASLKLSNSFGKMMKNAVKKFESNEFDKIIAQANKVLEIDKENAFAYLFRGVALWEKGDLKEGFSDFKKVLEMNEKAKNKNEFNDAVFPASAIRQFIPDLKRAIVSVVKIYNLMTRTLWKESNNE
jgi:tetratricopeptide (TPR) repeat protein